MVLWEAFETIVLPRRVTRRFRTTRAFYRYTWLPWSTFVHRFAPGKELDTYLGFYGPLSLLLLLVMWARRSGCRFRAAPGCGRLGRVRASREGRFLE